MPRTRRQSRRQTEFFDMNSEGEEMAPTQRPAGRNTSAAVQSPPPPAFITASDLASMMTSMQQAQADNFERLLTRVLEVRSPRSTPAPATAAPVSPTPPPMSGNFAGCHSRFSGLAGESLDGFIDAIEAYKDCANINEENAVRGLSMLLINDAATWWQGMKTSVSTWGEALQHLRSAFGDSRPPHRIYLELFSKPQGAESTELFVAKARAQLARIPSGDLSEKVKCDMIYGLLHVRIRKRLRREEFSDFSTLLQMARSIEESTKETSRAGTSKSAAAVAGAVPRAPQESPAPATTAPATIARPSSQRQRQRPSGFRRSAADKPTEAAPREDKDKSDQCQPINNSESRSSNISCYGCGESGVMRRNCAKCNSRQTFSALELVRSVTPAGPAAAAVGDAGKPSTRGKSKNCTQTLCEFKSVIPMVDTFSSNSSEYVITFPNDRDLCANPNIKRKYRRKQRKHKHNLSCQCPSQSRVTMNFPGQTPEISSSSRVTMNFSGKTGKSCKSGRVTGNDQPERSLTCLSIGSLHNGVLRRPIVGIEILGIQGRGLLDTAAKGTIAGSSLYELLQQRNQPFTSCSMRVKLADGSAPTRRMLSTTLEVKIKGKSINVDFYVFPDATNADTLLGIDFIKAAGLEINFGTSTWRFNGCEQVYPLEYEYPTGLQNCCATDILREDEGMMLSSPEREELASFLQHNDDIFRPGGEPTPYAEHRIDTGDHPPISVPPYRLTPAKKQLMKTELDNMLKDDIIEECESAWTSPAVLVPKKDNSIRFCVDYRKLNAITKTDSYPLPLIDELLQLTKRHCFMSSIDLKSGYWQVQVVPADRDKTAFVTPFGTYRFKRMPFGLKNAPSTFQRLIDRFRSGASLQGVVLLAYLDDLLVISEDFHSHLEDLQKVFDRLRMFGLRANRAKCFFARPEINYLGHVITPDGIKPDPTKVDAVLQMPSPKDLRNLKSFLQTCSWFRKFIPNFSQVAQPLTVLTRKNEPWRWESEQQEAFQALKDKLTSAPILVQADYSKEFVLRTDASNHALGAVLLQGDGPEERPIEYASRLLTPAERNYTTTEREALAVVWATDKFRGYLDGHPIVVKSDHQPLKWLLTLKTPNGRLIRWAMKLQALDIRYEYTPGKANVVADALSRPQCPQCDDAADVESCDVCSVIVDLPSASSAELRKEQLDDPEVAKIINSLEGKEPDDTQWLGRGYIMNQGVLYRYLPDTDTEQPQLVVPLTMREKILKEFHDAPTAGHQGVERTYNRISRNYYFVGMRKYISDYLKTCEECQRYKASNQKPAGLLQTPVLNQRGEVLAIDLFGPLPEGEHGEKWVLLVEDTATRWVELFALTEATAEICAPVLINEYFLRYGFPRRIISDNGVQFVSATMQQCMFILGIHQNLIPLYHPEANPAERKNRDLRTQLSILVKNNHRMWPKFLSSVRFSMNSATCSSTGASPAQLTFAREMRTPFDAQHDLRAILDKENFLPQITPYLRRFLDNWDVIRDNVERQQDDRKNQADKTRQTVGYQVGDLVFITTHLLSDASKGRTRKFMPKRDGPYCISKIVSPTTYEVTDLDSKLLGKFHASDLKPYRNPSGQVSAPVQPRRLRGRPRRSRNVCAEPPTGRLSDSEGEGITDACNETHPSSHLPALADSSARANRDVSTNRSPDRAATQSRHARLARAAKIPARFRD